MSNIILRVTSFIVCHVGCLWSVNKGSLCAEHPAGRRAFPALRLPILGMNPPPCHACVGTFISPSCRKFSWNHDFIYVANYPHPRSLLPQAYTISSQVLSIQIIDLDVSITRVPCHRVGNKKKPLNTPLYRTSVSIRQITQNLFSGDN
jgi:hypothetical protein